MEKIPTAEEIIDKWHVKAIETMGTPEHNPNSLADIMIEFTKLHVEAAVKAKVEALIEKSYEENSNYSVIELDLFTTDSYPLENIK